MIDQFTAEKMVTFLTDEVGMRIQDIQEKVGIAKGMWYSWQRSTKPSRRIELAEKILATFPEHFPNGEVPEITGSKVEAKPTATDSYQIKYIKALETTNEELRQERNRLLLENSRLQDALEKQRDRLRMENQTLLAALKEQIAQIHAHLFT